MIDLVQMPEFQAFIRALSSLLPQDPGARYHLALDFRRDGNSMWIDDPVLIRRGRNE